GRVTSAETLIQQTSDTMLLKVSELQDEIGIPFKVKNWEQGSLERFDLFRCSWHSQATQRGTLEES
ncbi:hypothetical protein, partial [Enterococcus faecalis]|uniref:hypothetical protein n=1 Tax=Enterococcus faecalis TaxID=1351 RepID=UPI003B0180AE